MTLTLDQLEELATLAGAVFGPDGVEIGGIGQIYLDVDTSSPEWLTVRTGRYGTLESFVPLRGATSSGTDISVCFDKWMVADAPRVDAGRSLPAAQERELYAHYGLTEDYESGFEDDGYAPSPDQEATIPERSRPGVDGGSRAMDRARLRRHGARVEPAGPALDHDADVTVPVRHARSDGAGPGTGDQQAVARRRAIRDRRRRLARIEAIPQQQMPDRPEINRAESSRHQGSGTDTATSQTEGGPGLPDGLRSDWSVLTVLGRPDTPATVRRSQPAPVGAAGIRARVALRHRSQSISGITLPGGLMTKQPLERPPASEAGHSSDESTNHDPGRASVPTRSGSGATPPTRLRRTSTTGAAWLALIIAAVVLVFMLIFILQNNTPAQFTLLAWSFTTPMGIAMLFAALAGALVTAMVGTTRMIVLRRNARHLERERAARA